jgi:hypothetical protein
VSAYSDFEDPSRDEIVCHVPGYDWLPFVSIVTGESSRFGKRNDDPLATAATPVTASKTAA